MQFAVAAVAVLASVVLFGAPVGAEPVPARATGVWSLGKGCNGGAPVAMVNSRAALMVENRDGKPAVAIARAEWAAGSIVFSFQNGGEELILPPLKSLRKCGTLPGMLPVVFAETVAVFRKFDETGEACLGKDGPGPRCSAVGFRMIDITRDGRLSRAEIGRAIRAAAFFIGHRLIADKQKTTFVPIDELSLAWFAGSALGPTVAGNLVDSYDYDGDGLLSLAELMQDRTPEEGVEGALAAMAAEMAPQALSAIMRSAVAGFLDILR
ncbi:MAG: hypothetical protein OYH76_06485 [Defluviicoccus sp.]|nr:hypothetical protein [Defluviicoccus sp.]MDE0275524.1 hypothetical protein [Defluviicoccus sp.]